MPTKDVLQAIEVELAQIRQDRAKLDARETWLLQTKDAGLQLENHKPKVRAPTRMAVNSPSTSLSIPAIAERILRENGPQKTAGLYEMIIRNPEFGKAQMAKETLTSTLSRMKRQGKVIDILGRWQIFADRFES